MTEEQKFWLELLDKYIAAQYNAIMAEGGGEVAEKLEGLFSAREKLLQRIINEDFAKK